ncbi:MAG TPA: ATP-binding protein [Candidatus Dormibacteraeota bacterium]|nr:ATP-binding protein [Candidatus Dormibacteraeota bacterium]
MGTGLALRFSNVLTEPDAALAESGLKTALSTSELELHLARELHDQVASPLISLVIELHELRAELGGDAEASQRLALLEESARQVLRQTREILIDLRGQEDLRLNFAHILRDEVLARFERRASLSLHVSPAWPDHISGWSAFNLSRIVHEAVTNAIRHGRAGAIAVSLDISSSAEAVVSVSDDGDGFDGVTGLGIAGMRERAVIMGGAFNACTGETGGTRVEVRIPRYRLD